MNGEGIVTEKVKERPYDLKSKGQGRMIQVSIPGKAGNKKFDYNVEVELVNLVADTVATPTFQGADVDWHIKADDIVLKKSQRNNQKTKIRIKFRELVYKNISSLYINKYHAIMTKRMIARIKIHGKEKTSSIYFINIHRFN